jgi:hypothetical protein
LIQNLFIALLSGHDNVEMDKLEAMVWAKGVERESERAPRDLLIFKRCSRRVPSNVASSELSKDQIAEMMLVNPLRLTYTSRVIQTTVLLTK